MEPPELRAVVAENIVRLAKKRGLSIVKLADHAQIDRAGLSRCLNGHTAMTTDRLCRIANALDVEPHELLRRRD